VEAIRVQLGWEKFLLLGNSSGGALSALAGASMIPAYSRNHALFGALLRGLAGRKSTV
jgi:pimeloyl-ACP methyl ester carboxylesterase